MSDTLVTKPDEAIALRLMQAIRADAERACAPDAVDLVSATGADPASLRFTPRIDRKTRTILFTGGNATAGDKTVMTATAVYRITPQA